jgi:hypothetical protein
MVRARLFPESAEPFNNGSVAWWIFWPSNGYAGSPFALQPLAGMLNLNHAGPTPEALDLWVVFSLVPERSLLPPAYSFTPRPEFA